jgi:hypothetical protein
MSLRGRFEPLNQVDRPTAVLTTAGADSFDDSSLRVSRRSPRSTGRLQPATSGHLSDQEIAIPMTASKLQPPDDDCPSDWRILLSGRSPFLALMYLLQAVRPQFNQRY